MNAADVCTHCGGSEGLIQFLVVCDPGCEPINAWLHPSCEQAWLASLPSPSEPAPPPRVHMKTTSNDDRRSGWRYQTIEQQRQYYDAEGFGSYQEVKPFYFPETLAKQEEAMREAARRAGVRGDDSTE